MITPTTIDNPNDPTESPISITDLQDFIEEIQDLQEVAFDAETDPKLLNGIVLFCEDWIEEEESTDPFDP